MQKVLKQIKDVKFYKRYLCNFNISKGLFTSNQPISYQCPALFEWSEYSAVVNATQRKYIYGTSLEICRSLAANFFVSHQHFVQHIRYNFFTPLCIVSVDVAKVTFYAGLFVQKDYGFQPQTRGQEWLDKSMIWRPHNNNGHEWASAKCSVIWGASGIESWR